MNSKFQSVLFLLYRWAVDIGFLSTPAGRWIFERAYFIYKNVFEAPNHGPLRTYARVGTTVIDVGANIGFFTTLFARWVEDGHVIAIEPEEKNFERLTSLIARRGLGDVVEPIRGAAAEAEGTLCLALNPYHPGDHRIADQGITVAAVSLDHLLAERGWPEVSLIKIDVQGAEERVLRGASETLQRYHPALLVEVDEDALAAMGSCPEHLFSTLMEHGYRIHSLERHAVSPPLSAAAAMAALRRAGSYLDFFFLHSGMAPTRGATGK